MCSRSLAESLEMIKVFSPLPNDDSPDPGAHDWSGGEEWGTEWDECEGVEPDPLEEEDLVVDDVEAEHAHGVVHVQVAS